MEWRDGMELTPAPSASARAPPAAPACSAARAQSAFIAQIVTWSFSASIGTVHHGCTSTAGDHQHAQQQAERDPAIAVSDCSHRRLPPASWHRAGVDQFRDQGEVVALRVGTSVGQGGRAPQLCCPRACRRPAPRPMLYSIRVRRSPSSANFGGRCRRRWLSSSSTSTVTRSPRFVECERPSPPGMTEAPAPHRLCLAWRPATMA